MKVTFVNGFPDNISVNLQQASRIMTMPISRARILILQNFEPGVEAVSIGNRPIGQAFPSKTGERDIKINLLVVQELI